MSGIADTIRKASAAVSEGKDPATELFDTPSQEGVIGDDSSSVVRAGWEDPEEDGVIQAGALDGNVEEEDQSSEETEDSEEESTETPSGSEFEVTVSDDKGRRKVKVDPNDTEKLKKFVSMAYGARKWQAERDQAKKSAAEFKSQLSEVQSDWEKLEKAYSSGGLEGLVELLDGPEALKKYRESVISKYEERRNATPQELRAIEAAEQAESRQRELDQLRKEQEEFRRSVEQERELAQEHEIKSRINPVFEKYRFSGTLGSDTDEHMFDSMLWDTALKNLEPYEEEGLELSPALVEREFKRVATAIRKRIGAQAKKQVSRAVKSKKENTEANVQSQVMRRMSGGDTAQSAADYIGKGDLKGLFRNFGKNIKFS